MKYYVVGKILTTHGIKGELKIKSYSDFDRFAVGNSLYIHHKNEYIEVKVKTKRDFGGNYLVVFDGLEDINLVLKYHSDDIVISDDEREELPKDEYYYSDLLDLKVYNEDDEYKGIVTGIREVPQGILLEVKNSKVSLVPFRKEFVASVDKEKIVIKEIEGLF